MPSSARVSGSAAPFLPDRPPPAAGRGFPNIGLKPSNKCCSSKSKFSKRRPYRSGPSEVVVLPLREKFCGSTEKSMPSSPPSASLPEPEAAPGWIGMSLKAVPEASLKEAK